MDTYKTRGNDTVDQVAEEIFNEREGSIIITNGHFTLLLIKESKTIKFVKSKYSPLMDLFKSTIYSQKIIISRLLISRT